MLTDADMPNGYVLEIATLEELAISDQGNDRIRLEAYITDGVLRYKVDARDPDDGSRGYVRGKVLCDLMLSHYGNRVVMIAGFWVKGDNLRLFNQHTALGLTKVEAASKTWTGIQAARYGFTVVKVDESIGGDGAYGWVRVFYTRPEVIA